MLFEGVEGCAFVGMVHLAPLPGSPGFEGDMRTIVTRAVRDAEALIDNGCDALIVENMGDVPYLRGRAEPETVAAMAIVTERIASLGRPTGVQVLAAANLEALGVAVAAGAAFIRVEAFAYAHVADEGILEASAGELLRRRRALAADVRVFADVQKKHASHAMTADLSIAELAKGTTFFGADALIVTGAATGRSTAIDDVRAAATAGAPVLVGSGVNVDDAAALAAVADGLIVGSFLKEDGDWRKAVDPDRVRAVRAKIPRAAAG